MIWRREVHINSVPNQLFEYYVAVLYSLGVLSYCPYGRTPYGRCPDDAILTA